MLPCLIILLVVFAAIVLYVRGAGPKLPPETDAIIDAVLQHEPPGGGMVKE